MITQIKVLHLVFLVVSIAAAGFSPQSLFAVQEIDQSVGLQVPRFCPALPAPSGPVVNVSTVAALVAAVNNAAAGTTILLADGIYALDGEYLRFEVPGVTLRSASGNREAVVLDGNYLTTEIIQIVASGVTIADLTLREAYYHPIHVTSTPGSHTLNTLIYNVHIIDPGEQAVKINPYDPGAAYFTDNGIVACSHIELTAAGRPHIRNNCYTGGIDAHQSRGWTIRDNLIEGFWCNDGLSEHAVHFWVTSRDTLVERNLLRNNARGVGFGLLEAQGAGARPYGDNPCPSAGGGYVDHYGGIIRNNFIYGDSSSLFASPDGFDCGICLTQACGARVLHNTVASTHRPVSSSIEWRYPNTNASIINNLVTHNLFQRDGATALQQNNLSGQPLTLFVGNGAGGDLHLKSSATAAINKAPVPADAPEDIDGNHRPAGPLGDIGADELSFLEIAPLSRVIPAGGQTTFTVSVTAPPGFSGVVSLSAPSPSADLLVSLAPAAVAPPGQSVLTVRDLHAGHLPAPISYTITVTGTGTGFNQSVQATVLVGGSLVYMPLILR
jgi:hypothetical protein